MDSFYSNIDYQPIQDKKQQRRRKPGIFYLIGIAVFIAFVLVGWYALRFIPAFDIRLISITCSGGSQKVPKAAVEVAASLKGVSLFAMKKQSVTDSRPC